jgi:shikimate kinase
VNAETLALIGAPAAGKTTVGRLVAEALGLPFTDVDALIEAREGRLIREIFVEDGEPHFRELELAASLEALSAPGVVALGGGAPMTPAVADALRELPVVWLTVSVGKAARRVGLDDARPLLLGNMRGTLIRLLRERTPVYESLASLTLDTDGAEPGELAERIVEWWQE